MDASSRTVFNPAYQLGHAMYVYDRVTDTIKKISVTTTGVDADCCYSSGNPTMSADGRWVVFTISSRLAAGDLNLTPDVYVRDRTARTTTLVTSDATGASVAGSHGSAVISANGRHVAFTSDAAFVAADTNGVTDVYVRDLLDGGVFADERRTGRQRLAPALVIAVHQCDGTCRGLSAAVGGLSTVERDPA